MPRALDMDWEVIKARYIGGAKPQDLCRDYALNYQTLSTRIKRGEWTKLRAMTAKDVSCAVERSLRERSQALRENLAQGLVETAQVMTATKPKPKVLRQHANSLKSLAQAGSIVFGWGDAAVQQRPINIAVLTDPSFIRPCSAPVTSKALDLPADSTDLGGYD